MKKIYEKCTYVILLIAMLIHYDTCGVVQMPSSQGMYHNALSLMSLGGKYAGQFFFECNATKGFKTSVALLGLWTIPLVCNIARWQWKKYRIKRKIRAETNAATIKAFHEQQALAIRKEAISVELLKHLPVNDIVERIVLSSLPVNSANHNDSQAGCGYVCDAVSDLSVESQQEIDRNVDRDMADIEYQPIMSQPVDGLNRLLEMRTICVVSLYVKHRVYDSGLQVLQRGFADGSNPGSMLMLGAAFDFASLCKGWNKITDRIFIQPRLWYKNNQLDPYMRIGSHLFASAAFYLNLMLIDYCVIQRLK